MTINQTFCVTNKIFFWNILYGIIRKVFKHSKSKWHFLLAPGCHMRYVKPSTIDLIFVHINLHGLVTPHGDIYLGWHWISLCFVALMAPSHYPNQCWITINEFLAFTWQQFYSKYSIYQFITLSKFLPYLPWVNEWKHFIRSHSNSM